MARRSVKNRARRGFALTVFRSPRISRFELDILGEIPQGGAAGTELIVARAFGSVIDAVGGVPFGASGSPVFVDGQLIGAISAVLSSDFRHVGITPLAAIIGLQNEPILERCALTNCTSHITNYVLPVSTGFRSTKAADHLRDRFGRDPYISPSQVKAERSRGLQDGSPVGVALLTGDLKLGFIGTVTLTEQSRVFAFGHPLLYAGPIRFPLTHATIVTTGGPPAPAKIGVLGDTIGTALQDRAAGVLGVTSTLPDDLVTLNLLARDGNRLVEERVVAEAVPLPSELPFLVFIASLETIVRAMNRVGSGSGTWNWRVSFAEGHIMEVSGEVMDHFDIAFAIAVSAFPLMEEALGQPRRITSVELEVNVRM
jgi:hypothetical protein